MDNVFIIAPLFSHFAVPTPYQHKVLSRGIPGALGEAGHTVWPNSHTLALVQDKPGAAIVEYQKSLDAESKSRNRKLQSAINNPEPA